MMKFTVKGLIALFVTSSTLFLTPMRSDAQVNMKTLAELAKSCQKDIPSKKYYQQMLLNVDKYNDQNIGNCIYARYHYSLILNKFPWLASTGEILPGYRGSVVVGNLANAKGEGYSLTYLVDCLVTQDVSSNLCQNTRNLIATEKKYRNSSAYISVIHIDRFSSQKNYLVYVCPSCVLAHDEISGSREIILKSFIKWFLKLDKPQRRAVISLLGDDNKARQLTESLYRESEKAVTEYWEARQRIEQQEQERRRQEILGN